MVSPITKVLNHLSDSAVKSTLYGIAGYLCSRVVNQIDPKIGIACGVTIGVISGLFLADGANTSSKVISIAAIIFVPFQVCQKLALPATFKMVLGLTSAALIGGGVLLRIYLWVICQFVQEPKQIPSKQT